MSAASRRIFFGGTIALFLAAFLVYWPALNGAFLWDDNLDLTENLALRDLRGLWRLWFAPPTLDYYPIKFTVQWVQWQLWGEHVLGYHVTNVLLHALGGVLLWRVFARLGLRFAWLGALIFVVHPLAVESVAWIAELKNVLSLPPLLLALLAWLDFDAHGAPRAYRRALAWFIVAMLCKTSVVMFPVTLVLFTWGKHDRITFSDARRLAPFFAVSLGLGLLTLWLQFGRALGGESLPLGGPLHRVALAGASLAFYTWKSLWPSGLLPIYPQWRVDPAAWWQLAPWVALVALAIAGGRARVTWGRPVLLGVGWFVLHLAPFLGFVPISFLRFTWVMDHFTYVPLPGLIGLALAGLERLRADCVGWVVGVGIASVLAVIAQRHAATYRDPHTFWSHTVAHHPDAWIARNNLGLALALQNDFAGAVREYEYALRVRPDYFEARMNLGNALRQLGRAEEGIAALRSAIQLRPNVSLAHYNLGLALLALNRPDEAYASLERAIQLQPNHADSLDVRGELLRVAGRHDEAQRDFHAALRSDPRHAYAHHHLAISLGATGRAPEALAYYETALRLKPDYLEARNNYAAALVAAGRGPEALAHFERVLQVRPEFVDARLNLALALIRLARADEAIRHLETLLRAQPGSLRVIYNLGVAQAARGRHDLAIAQFERALALDASFPSIHVGLAESLAATGRTAEARLRYAHARALDPALPERTF